MKGDVSMEKDLELSAAYDGSLKELEDELKGLMAVANDELAIAIMLFDDAHIPADALARLEKRIIKTKKVLAKVTDARSALVTYLANNRV